MRLLYIVHDLGDDAVGRRVRMLREGGAEVTLAGFRRTKRAPREVEGLAPIDLGRTEDARLGRRLMSVARAALLAPRWRRAVRDADVIMARQLETLALAAWTRRLAASQAPLVFECLDIHRLMTSPGRAGRLMRGVERWLLRRCALLVVSSPGFVREHFSKVHAALPPVRVLENKVLDAEAQPPAAGPPPGPPWRIGWFGVIRCARSLSLLAALAARLPGQVEVVIRGRPALNVLPEWDRLVATPGVRFLGPYDRRTELPTLYGGVHFSWTMDFYEQGANSDWLLPNRLYEGGLFGAAPLALAGVETGRWHEARGVGAVLEEPLEESLPGFFAGMTPERYASLAAGMRALAREAFVYDAAEAGRFVRELSDLRHGVPS